MKQTLLFIPSLIGFAAYLFWPEPAPLQPTRGKIIADRIAMVSELIEGEPFDCGPGVYGFPAGYRNVAAAVGTVVYWRDETLPEAEKGRLLGGEGWHVMGYQADDHIGMYYPPCHPRALRVFFHEIGHLVLGHGEGMDYEDEMEIEADYFAAELLRAYNKRSDK